MRAVPRGRQAAPVATMAPLIRSGELFSRFSDDEQADYFAAVSNASAEEVVPEHVFGTNGWQRRLAESGADPELAVAAFRDTWNSMTVDQRRAAVMGNAVARYFARGVADAVSNEATAARRDQGAVVGRNPDIGFLALGNPVACSEEYQRKLFGDYAVPGPTAGAEDALEQQGGEE